MKYHYGVIGATVWCDNCPWTTESHKNAQAIAKIHAKKHGHKVHGELTIAFGYDGRQTTKEEENERASKNKGDRNR